MFGTKQWEIWGIIIKGKGTWVALATEFFAVETIAWAIKNAAIVGISMWSKNWFSFVLKRIIFK